MPTAVTFVFAFVAVLALIGAAAWLLRRFASSRLGANTNRGRMPRLAVIDAAAVDGRRRLVLVRRDNVEHLLMIGGPNDIVVESQIVRAQPQAPPRDKELVAPPAATNGTGAGANPRETTDGDSLLSRCARACQAMASHECAGRLMPGGGNPARR